MVALTELVEYTDAYLETARFTDYCPNGLQVEGRAEVQRLASGVTANLALLEAAAEWGADAVVVHHGYFWKGESPRVTGMKRRRLQRLLDSGISLMAYHLPLDAHPVVGNNVCLAHELGLVVESGFGAGPVPDLALRGRVPEPVGADALAAHIAACLGRRPLHIAGGADPVHTVGWCTGAAQSYIEAAAALGLDAFISGEISEQTVHVAREMGIHYFAAGHHATERYGPRALGEHLAGGFGLTHRFIDIDNPA